MHKVASGTELTVLMLVIVPTHLLSQDGLVQYQFLDPVSEKTVVSIAAKSCISKAFAKLQLALKWGISGGFIICQFQTHDQREFIDYIKHSPPIKYQ